MSSALLQWERDNTSRWRRSLADVWDTVRRPLTGVALVLAGAVFGIHIASDGAGPLLHPELRDRVAEAEAALRETRGELELLRLERDRMSTVFEYSQRYDIPAGLAASIYDIALAEGIEPALAYRLVRVESQFVERAVSHKGAIGLTQVMPRTAFSLNPELDYGDLFRPEINLHLGFRYLQQMLERYQGNLRLALLAYNRGPGTVDAIRNRGDDPGNGYARAVLVGR